MGDFDVSVSVVGESAGTVTDASGAEVYYPEKASDSSSVAVSGCYRCADSEWSFDDAVDSYLGA